jgi:hypothetical protein
MPIGAAERSDSRCYPIFGFSGVRSINSTPGFDQIGPGSAGRSAAGASTGDMSTGAGPKAGDISAGADGEAKSLAKPYQRGQAPAAPSWAGLFHEQRLKDFRNRSASA